jgi:hypothetical protein
MQDSDLTDKDLNKLLDHNPQSPPPSVQRELLLDLLQHQAYRTLLHRLKVMHQDREQEMRKLLKQGRSPEAQVALGWVEAVEWMAELPKQMLKSASQQKEK